MTRVKDLTNDEKLQVELEIQGAIAQFPVGFNKLTQYLEMVQHWDPAKAHFYHYAVMSHLGNQLRIMTDQCPMIDKLKEKYEESIPPKGRALLDVTEYPRKKPNGNYH